MSHPTQRAHAEAEAAHLGEWESSLAPNPDADSPTRWFMWAAAVPLIAAYAVVPLAVIGWINVRDAATVVGWCLIGGAAVIAVIALVVAAVLVAVGLRILRLGRLILHRYSEGLVLERLKGRVVAARYDAARAELFVFENSSDGGPAWDERFAILTMPDASTAAVFAPGDPAAATELAARCGVREPSRISLLDAVDLRSAHEWR
ncbi:hypothetical protein [Gordonia neofelifaecis]|uniref:Integral membrane protein n=1 Tax=Gordonia neofelifaecis NRRL B-59395 TaxID=644548 RepID=F1YFL3_9ACTN|nr:hypothetical protein [Gordonia neofelifaecis]EGD56397.1 hypothetical protein SCNU_02552 [Gordonia neofelifaecis NRRL B-59395]